MTIVINFLKGVLIGIGAVAPGVSGGSFAVMMGVYDKLTDAIANFYKDFKMKLIFLVSIGLGVCVGIVGFSNLMEYLFEYYEAMVKFAFIGLMIGTLPFVVREANQKGFRRIYLLPCLIAFALTVLLAYLGSGVVQQNSVDQLSLAESLLYGGVLGFGTIVPGVSSSVILMYAGVYKAILSAISSLDLGALIPIGIGFAISTLMLAKFINYLFNRFYGYTYYLVLGFVIGSILTLFPQVGSGSELMMDAIVCVLLAVVSYRLGRLAEMRKQETEDEYKA